MAREAVSNFVDECAICVQGGNGGAGCVSFRREARVARGGPDGGDGGAGGDVWLVADHNIASLIAFKDHPHRRAGHGKHGSGKRRHGSGGQDCEVHVPVGTVVRSQAGEFMCDLAVSGQRWLAAKGGEGGRGNAKFLSNRLRAPAFAEQSEQGEERWLKLELKLLADVALVGFPNVGKSTFISVISAAKPKIADYPFTTLEPNLGVVVAGGAGRGSDSGDFDWVVADVPGLIEGASQGVGLGTRFLRHIERARVLVMLLDPMAADGTTLRQQLDVLFRELAAYSPQLLERPRLVTVSKADLLEQLPKAELAEQLAQVEPVDAVFSAVTGQGVGQLVEKIGGQVRQQREAATQAASAPAKSAPAESASAESAPVETAPHPDLAGPSADEIIIHRPLADVICAEREKSGWRITGRAAERAVALSDLTQPGALEFALERLGRLGVETVLRRAGVRDGDSVYVGQLEFEYADDEVYLRD